MRSLDLPQKIFSFLSPPLIYGLILFMCVIYGLIFSVNMKIGVALFFFSSIILINSFNVKAGLLPIIFLIPFDRLAKLNPEGSLTFAKVFIAAIAIVWFVKVLTKKNDRPIELLYDNPLLFLSFLFLVFSLASIVNTHNTDMFLSQNIRRISVVILLFLIVNIVDRQEYLNKVLVVLLISFFLVGLTGFYEIMTGDSILKSYWGEEDTSLQYIFIGGLDRISGPSGDPDFHAVSMILPSMIAVTFMLIIKSKVLRIMLLFVLITLVINVLATGSRGGFISLLLACAVYWYFTEIKWKYTVAAIAAGSFLIIILTYSLMSPTAPTARYTSATSSQSIVYRVGWTKMGVLMALDHPLLGIGTGNFPTEYNKYIRVSPEVPRRSHWPHNTYIQILSENGILGLLVFLALFVVATKRMVTVIRKTNDKSIRRLAVLILSVVIANFFFAGTSNVLENENYWIVFAFTIVVYNFFRKEQQKLQNLQTG